MANSSALPIVFVLIALTALFTSTLAVYNPAPLGSNTWYQGTSTWYYIAIKTGNKGHCGFPPSYLKTLDYTSIPNPRYSDSQTNAYSGYLGAACGSCYRVRCLRKAAYQGKIYCQGKAEVTVRVVDWSVPGPKGLSANHFELRNSTFKKIANLKAGIINMEFKRVPCPSKAGAKWTVYPNSTPYWKEIGVYDVPGTGNIIQLWVRPTGSKNYIKCQQQFGSHFSLSGKYTVDSKSSVRVVTAENKQTVYATYAKYK